MHLKIDLRDDNKIKSCLHHYNVKYYYCLLFNFKKNMY